MARDYLSLGSTPCDETCAQVGSDDYYSRMKRESLAYIKQLTRLFPNLPDGVYFVNKGFPHDFGTYHEVCVMFDDNDQTAIDAACEVENGIPMQWDTMALIDLQGNIIAQLQADLERGPNTTYDRDNRLV